MGKEKGITLIALVITIIVLLILAGVSLSLIAGENGILKRATGAVSQNSKAKAEEEILLVLNEWWMEKATGTKTLEEFLKEKIETNEIDDYEMLEEGKIAIYRNSYCIIIDENGRIMEEIQKAKPKLEATYEIVANQENKLQVVIQLKSEAGIQKVICPNGDIVNGNQETNIEINYEVEDNQQYEFIVEIQNEQQVLQLDVTEGNKIQIEAGDTGAYPIFTLNGVQCGRMVKIQNAQIGKDYYSLDEGDTWLKYTGPIKFTSTGSLKVKRKVNHGIMQIISKEIDVQLASDAINETAYDGDLSTYTNTWGGSQFALIDAECNGKYLDLFYYMRYSSSQEVKFYDKDNNKVECEIETLTETNGDYLHMIIPEGAVKLEYQFNNGWNAGEAGIREIIIKRIPPQAPQTKMFTIGENVVDQLPLEYPLVRSEGIANCWEATEKVKIQIQNTAKVTNYYTIDGGENWIKYTDIKEIVYPGTGLLKAKSVDEYGVSSEIVEIRSERYNFNSDIECTALDKIGTKAFDKDPNTAWGIAFSIHSPGNVYMNVEESAIGNTLHWECAPNGLQGGMQVVASFMDETGNVIGDQYIDVYANSRSAVIPAGTKRFVMNITQSYSINGIDITGGGQ